MDPTSIHMRNCQTHQYERVIVYWSDYPDEVIVFQALPRTANFEVDCFTPRMRLQHYEIKNALKSYKYFCSFTYIIYLYRILNAHFLHGNNSKVIF